MKILVFSPYYPPHIGGLESHSEEFNQHISKNGIDVVVYTPQIPKNTLPYETTHAVTIIRYPAFEIIKNFPVPKLWHYRFWQSFFALFHSHFDIVISRTRFFLSSLLACLYAKLSKTYWIHIEHGSDFIKLSSSFKTKIAKLYDRTIGKIILRHSNMNISISRTVQSFVARFDDRPSPVIYRGIDFESIDAIPPDDAMRRKYPGKIIISTAARLYKWKGIEFSIGAIRNLPEAIQSKIVFLIMGDGEDFKRLNSLTDGLPIEMLGNLPREKVIAILKRSDIYIHSSLPGGGLSTSLLEAMYTGCAVIATPNEGASEIVNDNNGILIERSSETLIRKNIILLVENDENRHAYSENAKKDVSEKFLWGKSIDQYLEIFKNI